MEFVFVHVYLCDRERINQYNMLKLKVTNPQFSEVFTTGSTYNI